MFEKFLSANKRDFATRYQGTYGFFRNNHEGKAPMLARLMMIEDSVQFVDRNNATYELQADSNNDIGFEFLPPKSGFFNTDSGAVYVERLARRQFQRGVSDANTRLFLMGGTTVLGGFKSVPVNFPWLERVYNSKITVAQAFASFCLGGTKSVAISSQFCMDAGKVYIFGTIAGNVLHYSIDSVRLELNDPVLFRTEIYDALKGIVTVDFVKKEEVTA